MQEKYKKIELLKALKEQALRLARSDVFHFTKYTMRNFEETNFHKNYYSILNKFASGDIKKLMVFIPPQSGKLLPANTPILTTNGWKEHGELKRGDYVFGQDGKPKKVLRNFGVIDWNVNEIIFAGGTSILAAKEHLWKLQVEYDDHKGRRECVLETQQIFNRRHRRAPCIDIAPALDMPVRELPINPYILGCWLGDGHSRQGVLTVGKQDIEHFARLGEAREVKPGIYRVLINGLSKQLRECGLILNKHIPMDYLLSSKEQRYELLRGLMDTDGYVDGIGGGCCEFTQKSNRLVQDVYILLRTLGIKARINEYNATINGEIVGKKVRITFNPNRTEHIFSLPRKQERLSNKIKADRRDKYRLFIKSINPHGVVKGNCIQVEGSMYLAGYDLIPTHNSEGATRRLPAYILGQNPNTKIAILSYSTPKARKFNLEIQRIIDSEKYKECFPETRLNTRNITALSGSWLRNAYECEIVGSEGGFKTVGVGGALTGEPVDVLIMDDIYKSAQQAWSETVRESINNWYDTVAETRLHNDSRQLIVFTRWHEKDLAGRLLEQQGEYSEDNSRGWHVVTYKAIKEGAPTPYDNRQEGEALWPQRHSLEKLISIRDRAPHVFNSLYQQDPRPIEGLLYDNDFKTYSIITSSKYSVIKAYVDTADEGKDYLCAIVYNETEDGNYVLDVLYTQRPMEYTEQATAELLTKYKVEVAVIESNNGGRGFARNVERIMRVKGNSYTRIKWFHQSLNKNARIFTHSADVQNMTFFPNGWEHLFSEFYKAVKYFMRTGTNIHDDAPDTLTGMVEFRTKEKKKDVSQFFY